MWFGYSILPVTAVSGLIAGGGLFAFIASALAAASALWLPRASDVVIPTLYANLDPQTPDGALLLSAFRESLNRVRRTRHPLLLRLTAFAREAKPAFSLDLTREGDAELACGSR